MHESILTELAQNQSCVINDLLSRKNISAHWQVLFPVEYIGATAFTLIFLTGVPLNLYIIAVLVYKRLYSQPTFLLLINLALSDLLMCVTVCLYNIITRFVGQASFGRSDYERCQVCKIGSAFVLFGFSTAFITVFLSLDRLLFFSTPLRYEKFVTTKKIILALAVTWVLSVGLAIPPLLGHGDLVFAMVCGYIFAIDVHIRRSVIYISVTGMVLAVVSFILVFSNAWIAFLALRVINRKNKHVHPSTSTSISRTDSVGSIKKLHSVIWSKTVAKQQFRFFQTFGALVVINLIIFLPALVLGIMLVFTSEVPLEFVSFVQVSMISQSTLHPLVQVLFIPELKRLLMKPCGSNQCQACQEACGFTKCWKSFSECMNKCFMHDLWTKEVENQLRKGHPSPSTSSHYNIDQHTVL